MFSNLLGFYSMKQVQAMIPLSRVHIKRLEDCGQFVRRVRLTDDPRGRFGYPKEEIHEWIANRSKPK